MMFGYRAWLAMGEQQEATAVERHIETPGNVQFSNGMTRRDWFCTWTAKGGGSWWGWRRLRGQVR